MTTNKDYKCPVCGTSDFKVENGYYICQICGNQTVAAREEKPQEVPGNKKDKWLAVLLCLLFGCFGAHRFYEGKFGTGLLWFFTCGLFGFGWLMDLILLLGKPDPYYV